MAHPSDTLPKDVYVLDGTNALVPSSGNFIFAMLNPTDTAINATVKGSIYNWDSGSSTYKQIASSATILPVLSWMNILFFSSLRMIKT
jgi:hypothetical protein